MSDIVSALQDAARAGASAASTAGRDLTGDIETYVVPHLREIGLQVAAILQRQQSGSLSADIAQSLLASQCDAVKELIETVATLVVVEIQLIYTAIIGALNDAVNKAAGFALL